MWITSQKLPVLEFIEERSSGFLHTYHSPQGGFLYSLLKGLQKVTSPFRSKLKSGPDYNLTFISHLSIPNAPTGLLAPQPSDHTASILPSSDRYTLRHCICVSSRPQMPSLALKFVFSLTHVYTVLACSPMSPVIEQRFRCHHCHFNTLLNMKKRRREGIP